LCVEVPLRCQRGPVLSLPLTISARRDTCLTRRWTDNVWTIKTFMVEKFGKDPSEVDRMMGLPGDFDYVK
jgi:hypothetical protein